MGHRSQVHAGTEPSPMEAGLEGLGGGDSATWMKQAQCDRHSPAPPSTPQYPPVPPSTHLRWCWVLPGSTIGDLCLGAARLAGTQPEAGGRYRTGAGGRHGTGTLGELIHA